MKFGSLFDGIGCFSLALQRSGMQMSWSVEIDPECRRVTRERFPGVTQHEDVNHVGSHNLDPVDLVVGGFPCFAAGTLILCKRGLIPIESVEVGDLVWTHENRWRSVTSTMRRIADETLTLKGGLHHALVTTDEHPFWVSDGKKRKYKPHAERSRGNWYDHVVGEPEWIEAKDVEGKYLSSPVMGGDRDPPAVEDMEPQARGVTSKWEGDVKSLMWIAGAWLGDGWLRRRKDRGAGGLSGFIVCCPAKDADELLNRMAKASLTTTRVPERTADKFIVSSKTLAHWLHENFGEYSSGKRIPAWLLECKEEYRRAFLNGYLWADGCGDGNGWKTTTVSKAVAVGTALLGRSLGYACSLYYSERPKTCTIEGRVCNQRSSYQVVGRKFEKQTSAFVLGGHSFAKCRKAERTGPAEVFNISVEGDESYVADGVVCHNCQDLSVAGRRSGLGGARSGLWWEFRRILAEIRPRWVLIENVPGLLSSWSGDTPMSLGVEPGPGVGEVVLEEGSDLDALLFSLGELGYGWAYSVLDARYFHLAQRRERVFIVGCLGDGSRLAGKKSKQDAERLRRLPAEVLFESESVPWNPPPGRKARTDAARATETGAGGASRDVAVSLDAHMGMGGVDDNAAQAGQGVLPEPKAFGGNNTKGSIDTATACNAKSSRPDRLDFESETFVVEAAQCHGSNVGPMGTLRAGNGNEAGGVPFVAHTVAWRGRGLEMGGETANAIRSGGSGHTGDQMGYVLAATLSAGTAASPGVNPPGRRREDDTNLVAFGIARDCLDRSGEGKGETSGERSGLGIIEEASPTIKAKGPGAVAITPIDMRQASRGEKMTNKRVTGSSGGPPGTGVGESGDPAPSLAGTHTPAIAFHVTQDPVSGEQSPCLSKGNAEGCGTVGVLAFTERGRADGTNVETQEDLAYSLTNPGEGGRSTARGIATPTAIRRLTPTECLRLQGLPDGWLDVDPPLSDSAKYRMIGNGGAITVVEWIGQRVVALHKEVFG